MNNQKNKARSDSVGVEGYFMESGNGRRDRLLRTCIERLTQSVARSIEPGFKLAGEEMVVAAKHPTDGKLRTEALNGLHALDERRPAFERAMKGECARLLTHTRGSGEDLGPESFRRHRGLLPTGEGLSLMDEDALENKMALETFVARAETRYAQELYALSSRLGLILGKKFEELSHCPLGPALMAPAIARAIAVLKLPPLVAPLFAKGYCEALLVELADYYYEVNNDLAAAGILANLKYKRINRGRIGQRASERKAQAQDEEQRTFFNRPASPSPGESAQAVASIRSLLREVRPGPLGDPSGHRVGTESVDRALSQLQSSVATGQIDGGVKSQELKQRMLDAISRNDYGGQGVQLDLDNSHTIEIMSQLFDFVGKQRLLNQRLSDMIGKLQVPLYRVAVNNGELLESESHPARRFFNVLADTGKHWSETDKRDATMLSKMELVVDRVVNEYDGDDEIFEELFEDLNSHIEVAEKRARLSERRSVEAARGLEKLQQSRLKAKGYIDVVVEKYELEEQPIPRDFLGRSWVDYLTLVLLREDADQSKVFQQACLAAETLGTHNRSGLNQEHMEKLLVRRKPLEAVVSQGLNQIGWSKSDRVEVWNGLCGWMDARIARRSPRSLEPIVLPENAQFAEALKALPSKVPSLSEAQKRILARLKTIPFGTWFEFVDDNVLRKLAWYSPVSNHVLFVNNRGVKSLESTLHELAIWIECKQAMVFKPPVKPLFDRALDAIQAGLKKLKDGLSGGPGLSLAPA